jgi:hypothetical protein
MTIAGIVVVFISWVTVQGRHSETRENLSYQQRELRTGLSLVRVAGFLNRKSSCWVDVSASETLVILRKGTVPINPAYVVVPGHVVVLSLHMSCLVWLKLLCDW